MGNFEASSFESDSELQPEGIKKTSSSLDAVAKLESATSAIDSAMEAVSPLMRAGVSRPLSKSEQSEIIGLDAFSNVPASFRVSLLNPARRFS